MPKLTVDPHGYGRADLYMENCIILVRYPEGDCDTITWPLTGDGRTHLASALYDIYETGGLTVRDVTLPDGTTFNIDDNLCG